MKLEIVKKAYIVYHEGMLNENPYLGYQSIVEIPSVYADSPSSAKTNPGQAYDYPLNDEDPTYLDLRARRATWDDIVKYKGSEKKRHQVNSILEREKRVKERTDLVNRFPDDANFYVQNGFVGNSVLFWAKGSSGYTTDITKAELYTKKEILKSFVNGRDKDRIWYAKHINENIKSHVDGQNLKNEMYCC